ncbi:MAG: protein kinase [Kofleriaceae bacterium]|nr:protein kinase [Kofleriaceae bacterium]
MIGTLAGSYKITDLINVGGMGSVYRAEHTLIGRIAAVKVLHPEMSASRDIVNRFFNEARVTTSIKHPGIVEVYDFGYLESGHAYLVMEFLEGAPLATRNKQRGPVGEGEAAAILKGVCSALAAAHAKGVVHRDLKPDNIFMVPDPDAALGVRPKLLDFGIAKLTEPGLASSATKTGAVMGTPTYMSPEQCRGTGDVDHRADLYSIGCMFYEMLAGRPPFVDRGAGELIGAHLFVNPEPPSRYVQGISPDTEALVMSLLAKQPAQRPQTALELGQRFAQISQRTGWGSSTSWEQRPSVASLQAQANAQHLTPGSFTPAPQFTPVHPTPGQFTPAHPTPGQFTPANAPTQHGSGVAPHYTPAYTPAPAQPPTQPSSEKPTTLSGAASHSIAQTPKRGNKWLIPAVALVALVGGGIAIATFTGGGKKDEHATSAPSETGSTKKMTPRPDTTQPDTAKTATDPTKTAVDPTKPATDTTNPTTDTTKAATDTTNPAADPTKSATDPTKSASDATKSATDSTKSATDSTKSGTSSNEPTKTSADATKTSADATKTAADTTKTPATSSSKAATDPTKTSHAKTPDATADPSKTATKKSTTKKTKKDPTSDPLLETDL